MKHSIVIIFLLLAAIFTDTQAQNKLFTAQFIDGVPKLEIIQARQTKIADTPPLLFVHGQRMGSWIFEDNYLPFFHERGFDVFAINLRGHGRSEGAENIAQTTLDEYYNDLEKAIAYIESETGETPLLIGYAMGAVLTQKYIHQDQPEAAVLLSMGDIGGGLSHYHNWSKREFPEKIVAMQQAGNRESLQHDPTFQRALFFYGEEKPEGHKKYITKLVTQAGSAAIWADLENFVPQPIDETTKVLIVAGEQDPFTPPAALQRARRLYHAEVLTLENTRHGVPVGENWKKGAKGILKFLRQLPTDKEEGVTLMGVVMKKN